MKYGESLFDIAYLVFAILCGLSICRFERDRLGRWLGASALILGLGDAFHLVPRVMNYFTEADLTAWLGAGKCVTSITMTLFYVCLFAAWRAAYREKADGLGIWVGVLAALRIGLCLFPQNRWLTNDGPLSWSVIRNVPFVLLGAIMVWLFFRKRREIEAFCWIWLYILLSFLFYIPVAVGAGAVPILGMLMLPKTICYVLTLAAMLRYARGHRTA